ncbi:hypothetical protein OR16_40079 [Cupriavidus basilensis OR16]|uniref:Uncharacterized protein n=1 Tax=Cupriavidus basilensis OR16 TaxID=1127483 RepID=H1SHS1_9BURK|nr:hypothetical protein [Cupriavidus basilensis]EHP37927.1 hypothetical protein OR16_40079 [Cupriavidus basilensis OR16]
MRNLVVASVATSLLVAGLGILLPGSALAERQFNNTTRTSVNRNANVNANSNVNVNRNANVNRTANVNTNTNVNVNRNVNVNVQADNNWHPVATAAVVATTAVVTTAVVGSIVHSVPPSCVPVVVNGVTFQQCGTTWYQPQYAGSAVQYVVVAPPR